VLPLYSASLDSGKGGEKRSNFIELLNSRVVEARQDITNKPAKHKKPNLMKQLPVERKIKARAREAEEVSRPARLRLED
jgi:hypothetical protein